MAKYLELRISSPRWIYLITIPLKHHLLLQPNRQIFYWRPTIVCRRSLLSRLLSEASHTNHRLIVYEFVSRLTQGPHNNYVLSDYIYKSVIMHFWRLMLKTLARDDVWVKESAKIFNDTSTYCAESAIGRVFMANIHTCDQLLY